MRVGSKVSPQLRRLEQLDAKSAPARSAPVKAEPSKRPLPAPAVATLQAGPGFDRGLTRFFDGLTNFFRSIFRPVKVDKASLGQGANSIGIQDNGASQKAVDMAKWVADAMVTRPEINERMQKAKVTLVIIPRDTKLTDLPEFRNMRGKQTFDGRNWDEIRGVAGQRSGGKYLFAVAEENLDRRSLRDLQGPEHSTMHHELAHAIHVNGLDFETQDAIAAAYDARKAAGGPWTESYASTNEFEYFAQATNCYFGWNGGAGEDDPAWLKQNDPAIYSILEKVYGPPPER